MLYINRQSDVDAANPLLDSYNLLLAAVHATPSDFNAWTNVITAVEKLVRELIILGWLAADFRFLLTDLPMMFTG